LIICVIYKESTFDTYGANPESSAVGRSAYHFCAYALIRGDVKQVFDAGSKGMPDFVINQNEYESILITQKTFVNGEWRRTEDSVTDVYAWNGAKYELLASVPWKSRLMAVSGLAARP
jgi:hypothetical protein